MGGGNVAGAVGGTIAGDYVGNAVGRALGDSVGSNVLANAAAGLAGAAAGGVIGGSAGAMAGAGGALNAEVYNRQLHEDEKAAIRSKANGNKAQGDKLTRAACYAVKCWAEYPKGSDQYNANYVSQAELVDLQPELDWVKSQQAGGQFVYSSGDHVRDTIKGTGIPVADNGGKLLLAQWRLQLALQHVPAVLVALWAVPQRYSVVVR